jgi:hypothetical protein
VTTHPDQEAGLLPVTGTDAALAARAATSATVLHGILTAGMLDQVGQPRQLPTLIWADADPALVQAVWDAGLAVGIRAGRFMSAPRWDADALTRLRTALAEAGYDAMAAAVRATMDTAPSQHPAHPADTRTARPHPDPWQTDGRRSA